MKPEPEDSFFQKVRNRLSAEKSSEPEGRREGRVITSVPISPQNRSIIKRGGKGQTEKDAEPPSATVAPAPVPAPPPETPVTPPDAEEVKPMRPSKAGTAAAFQPSPTPYTRKEGDLPPPIPRRRKNRTPRSQRVTRIAVWKAKRGIVRVHARFPLWQVTVFYLGLVAVGSVVIGSYMLANTPKAIVSEVEPLPPDKMAKKLFEEIGVLMTRKEYEEAWKKVQRLQQLQPDNPSVYLMEGAIMATRKDYDQARAAFNKASELSPGTFAPHFNLAEMEFTAGNYAEAERQFRLLRKNFKPNKLVLFRIYLCALLQKHRDDARLLVDTPDIDSQSPEWFYIQALEAMEDGRKSEGKKLLQTARMLFGQGAEAYDQTLVRVGYIK